MCLLIIPFDTHQIEIVFFDSVLFCSGCKGSGRGRGRAEVELIIRGHFRLGFFELFDAVSSSLPEAQSVNFLLSEVYNIITDQESLFSLIPPFRGMKPWNLKRGTPIQ